jgi:tRNA (uracil-5-)-methyltransferase TRM9
LFTLERLIESVSPAHGRVLIYVWAIEQDTLSKRIIPTDGQDGDQVGKDVMVPWVLSRQPGPTADSPKQEVDKTQIFHRYYHMFAKGELTTLVHEAAQELRLEVGPLSSVGSELGLEVVQDGWERSNYYVELRRWEYHP